MVRWTEKSLACGCLLFKIHCYSRKTVFLERHPKIANESPAWGAFMSQLTTWCVRGNGDDVSCFQVRTEKKTVG